MNKGLALRIFKNLPKRGFIRLKRTHFGDVMYTDRLNEHSRLEEEYFYKKDRELIDKMHEEERKKQELLARTAHYHKCSSCGHGMKESVHDDLQILQCQNCENVSLSMETLELLTQGRRFKNLVTELQIRREESLKEKDQFEEPA
jgi:hypothetical protein